MGDGRIKQPVQSRFARRLAVVLQLSSEEERELWPGCFEIPSKTKIPARAQTNPSTPRTIPTVREPTITPLLFAVIALRLSDPC